MTLPILYNVFEKCCRGHFLYLTKANLELGHCMDREKYPRVSLPEVVLQQ